MRVTFRYVSLSSSQALVPGLDFFPPLILVDVLTLALGLRLL